jgi:hypothetical protein
VNDTPFDPGTLAARIYAALSPHYEGLMGETAQSMLSFYEVIYHPDERLIIKVFRGESVSAPVVPVADQGTVFALLAEVVSGGGET